AADRMNGCEVEDIETKRRDFRQAFDDVLEGAVPSTNGTLAARKDFVPGAGAGKGPVGDEGKRHAPGQVRTGLAFGRRFGHDGVEQGLYILLQIKRFTGPRDRFPVGFGARLYLVEQVPAFLGLE